MRPVNVLLLGDSIDFRIARHLCNISKHEEHLEKFTNDPIGQEHNMTGLYPVLLCTQIHYPMTILQESAGGLIIEA